MFKTHNKFFLIALLVVLAGIILTYFYAIAFSGFPVAMTKALIGMLLFWLFDKYAMHQIDTLTELKKGNIAYAIFVFGYCVIVAAAIAAS